MSLSEQETLCLLKFLYLVFETRIFFFFFGFLHLFCIFISFPLFFNSATLRYILSYRDNACYVFPSIASISSNTYLFIVTSDFKLHMEITKISVVVVRDRVTAWPPGQSGNFINFIHRLNQKSPLARPQVNDLARLWFYRVYGRWQIRLVVIVVECENAERTVYEDQRAPVRNWSCLNPSVRMRRGRFMKTHMKIWERCWRDAMSIPF